MVKIINYTDKAIVVAGGIGSPAYAKCTYKEALSALANEYSKHENVQILRDEKRESIPRRENYTNSDIFRILCDGTIFDARLHITDIDDTKGHPFSFIVAELRIDTQVYPGNAKGPFEKGKKVAEDLIHYAGAILYEDIIRDDPYILEKNGMLYLNFLGVDGAKEMLKQNVKGHFNHKDCRKSDPKFTMDFKNIHSDLKEIHGAIPSGNIERPGTSYDNGIYSISLTTPDIRPNMHSKTVIFDSSADNLKEIVFTEFFVEIEVMRHKASNPQLN